MGSVLVVGYTASRDVFQADIVISIAERPQGAGGAAVVGHDPGRDRAKVCVTGYRGPEDGDGALLPLIGQDPREGEVGGIFDPDLKELPPGAAGCAILLVSNYAMAEALEMADRFDVDAVQLGLLVRLIAPDRLGRFECRDAVGLKVIEEVAGSRQRNAELGDLLAGPLLAQDRDLIDNGCWTWLPQATRS